MLHAVFNGPSEHAKEAGVLSVVVGLDAEEFAQFGDNLAFRIFNNGAIAGGPGIAAGTAVAVGCEPRAGRVGRGGWVCK